MKTIDLMIGEHHIQVVSKSFTKIRMLKKNFRLVTKSFITQPDLVIHLLEGYGIPFVDYKVDIIKVAKKVTYRRSDYLIEVDSNYTHAKVSVYDEFALKHALLNLYSSFIVHHNWGLLIHSSCVVEKGEAHIFAGHSGAGKSTAAKLSHPRPLLSDEATIVKVNANEITIYNSPFRSELESTGDKRFYPLESIQLLYQANHNKRNQLSKSDALLHLIDKVFYWTNSPEETKNILHLIKILVQTVPVYELHFQKNNTFWELIS